MTEPIDNQQQFERARSAWGACSGFRATRDRMKRFAYGRQWDDLVKHNGVTMTLRQRARRNHCEPVTNNLLRQIIKSVVGRFRGVAAQEPGLREPLKSIAARNQLDELDARSLEEFLISGCAVQRIDPGERPEGPGPWVDIVSPARFFVNNFKDPRGHDIEVIGMLHDLSMAEILMRFGKGDDRHEARLRAAYRDRASATFTICPLGTGDEWEFANPAESSRCRVIEVWTRHFVNTVEGPAQVNHGEGEGVRRRVTTVWQGGWYAPDGTLLDRCEADIHPFVVKLYPLIDGEVHPFIEDIIDRQIQVNRTLTIVDRLMAVSAKELLLMPSEAVIGGDDWKLADYARAWGRPGAVIPYKSSAGVAPAVINTAGINSGLSNLLSAELQMMEQVSGVSSALQGMTPTGTSTAALYNAQTENSVQGLRDIFDTFHSFRNRRNDLLMAMTERMK